MTLVERLRRDLALAIARAEKAEARAERLAALVDALLWEGTRPACMIAQQRAIDSARAAVDAHGDLGGEKNP